MRNIGTSFFAMNFILAFAVIGFILIVFDLHRFAFASELVLLLAFMFLLAFAMFLVYHGKKKGWTLLGLALVLLLLDVSFIFMLTGTFGTAHLTTIFFSIIGLAVALLNHRETGQEHEASEIERHEKDYYPYIDKMESKEEPKIEKTFTPGKFVASKKANKFHVAKCDWAKRVSKENQIWFNSKEEAVSQGFQADKCVI